MKLYDKLVGVAADKWLHFLAGLLVAQVVIAILKMFVSDPWCVYGAGMAAALVVGFIKELKDGKEADVVDFVFTMVGGIVGGHLALII